MKNKKWIVVLISIIVVVAGGYYVYKTKIQKPKTDYQISYIKPAYNDMLIYVSTTGMVQPEDRIVIKPDIPGRIDKVQVKEGQHVQSGQTLILMSSTDRASLLDAAKLKGSSVYKYWEDVYKPIPLLAPINGEVIAVNFNAGQAVGLSDELIVLSDHLIVKAQVDETDIGKIKLGQKTNIYLDAYPNDIVTGKVIHISYESTVVNNVTIYEVEIILDKTPAFFRSGMSANINILVKDKKHVLTLPLTAIQEEGNKKFVLVQNGKNPAEKVRIKIGLMDDTKAEIISGLNENNQIEIKTKKYNSKKKVNGSPLSIKRPGGAGSKAH
ncbi:MAG: efflux RND transporter periplasmic adaptor subunit [Candidatus Margulisbacteria bacterium]|nr:efflux RND transporter periplasmic adaptor subunit [Candidatus Margulisiibacteriota bacterium]